MNGRLAEILRRRAELVARSGEARAEIAHRVVQWQRPLSFVDAGFALARRVFSRPVLLVLGIAALNHFHFPRLALWAGRIVTGWQLLAALRQARAGTRQ